MTRKLPLFAGVKEGRKAQNNCFSDHPTPLLLVCNSGAEIVLSLQDCCCRLVGELTVQHPDLLA